MKEKWNGYHFTLDKRSETLPLKNIELLLHLKRNNTMTIIWGGYLVKKIESQSANLETHWFEKMDRILS